MSIFDAYTPVTAPDFVFPADCNPVGAYGQCWPGVGDGIVAISSWQPPDSNLAVAPGAYIASTDPSTLSVTLAAPYTSINAGGVNLWYLPVKQRYKVETSTSSTLITVVSGPRLLRPGDMIWSDAFPFGTTVIDTMNGLLGTPSVAAGGSGILARQAR